MASGLRDAAKQLINSLPTPLMGPLLMRYRHFHSRKRHRDLLLVHRKLGGGWVGMSGPFAGMTHSRYGFGNCTINRLLGLYEAELHDSIERLRRWKPDRIINVGAAEGYYAVGLARLIPGAHMIAFEADRFYRFLLRKVIAANNLAGKIDVREWCSVSSLKLALEGARRPAIIIDCEGFEDELLDPDKIPDLKHTAIIVEIHEMFVPGVDERIRERFKESHEIVLLHTSARKQQDWAAAKALSESEFSLIAEEHRGYDMQWYAMWPYESDE